MEIDRKLPTRHFAAFKMAACVTVCLVLTALVSGGWTMPGGGQVGPDRLTAEFLTDYLNRQQRLPLQVFLFTSCFQLTSFANCVGKTYIP